MTVLKQQHHTRLDVYFETILCILSKYLVSTPNTKDIKKSFLNQ